MIRSRLRPSGARWPCWRWSAAALGLLAASRPWVHAASLDPVLGRTTVTASGREAAAVVPAVALVALAGGVALLLARTVGRRVAGLLLVVAGAAQVAATVGTLRSPAPAHRRPGRPGRRGGGDGAESRSRADRVALARRRRRRAGRRGRRPGGAGTARAAVRYDPRPGTSRPERGRECRRDRRAPAADAARTRRPAEDPPDTWDALSRGEDPTR